jgi:hypothetical protein
MSSFPDNDDKPRSGRTKKNDNSNPWDQSAWDAQAHNWAGDFVDIRDKWRKRRRERFERDLERGHFYQSKAGGIVGEIVDLVMDAVDSAVESGKTAHIHYQQQRMNAPSAVERYREETYKRLVKKIQQTEKKLDSSKRGVVFFVIMSACFGISMIFGDADLGVPALIFGGCAAMAAYSVRETRQKLFRLQDEHEEFLALAPPVPSAMGHRTTAAANFTAIEKTVLRYAFEHQGKVYPELLVIESEFSLAEVEQYLKHASEKRIAAIENDTNGRTFYYFATLDNSDPYAGLS